jgi:transitional endoplasmic reticulum ATPase
LFATITITAIAAANDIRRDPSGAEVKDVSLTDGLSKVAMTDPPQKDETATAILKKKKKPNSLM